MREKHSTLLYTLAFLPNTTLYYHAEKCDCIERGVNIDINGL